MDAHKSLVGMTGFEPAASSSRTTRATGLRYIPKLGEGEGESEGVGVGVGVGVGEGVGVARLECKQKKEKKEKWPTFNGINFSI